MGGAVGQIKLTVFIDAFVLGVPQMRVGRTHHAVELGSSPWLNLKLVDPDEMVELLFAHAKCLFLSQK